MAHNFRDYLGNVTQFENEAATGSEKRPVVGLAAATVQKFTDMVTHLAALVATITANRVAVNVDSTTTGKLDSVIAALDPGLGHTGQNTDIDQVSESLGSQSCSLGVWVKNISTASQNVYINYTADGAATTTNGWELQPGEQDFFPAGNVSELQGIASAVDAKVCWRTE